MIRITTNHIKNLTSKLFVGLLCTLLTIPALAQEEGFITVVNDTVFLEGFIGSDKALDASKVYILKHNVKIDKDATLTIGANTTLLFYEGTSLVVEGGLQVNGLANELVQFASMYENAQGTGILVRGSEGADVSVNYARFTKLTTPLNFEMDWFRSNVNFEDCIFEDMNTGESNILILSPYTTYQNTSSQKVSMSFSRNNFINTWGGIYIENLEDNILDLRFNNNLITNNVVYGLDLGVPSNTPIFGFFDGQNRRFQSQFKENSIYGNYQINASNDTIIREIGMGIQGEGEKFLVPNNFYRSEDPKYVSSTFDHFYQNDQLPLLLPSPILNVPSATTHGHIYRVDIDEVEIQNYMALPEFGGTTTEFTVLFNRPVNTMGDTQLESVFFDTINGALQVIPIEITNGTFSNNNMVYTFSMDNNSLLSNPLGYLVVSNFIDNEGFDVPDFTIGQMNAINRYNQLYQDGVVGNYFAPQQVINDRTGFLPDEEDIETLEQLTELGDLSYLGAYTSLAKTWEVGVKAGTAKYFGEMATQFLDVDDFRWSFGVYGQYNISRWFSARLTLAYNRIAGEDVTDSDLGRRRRLGNFRNDIIDGAATVHFHLLQYGISKGEKFSPSIYIGVGAFYNNPISRIFLGTDESSGDPLWYTTSGALTDDQIKEQGADVVWIPMQPIGTEGQTTGIDNPDFDPNGSQDIIRTPPDQYKKWNLTIPMGINLDFLINKRWTLGLDIAFRYTSTDYLDDVSGYYFDRTNFHQSIVNANGTVQGFVREGLFKKTTVTLPNTIQADTDADGTIGGGDEFFHPAQLLANPSLVNGTTNNSQNDAFSFPDARKGEVNKDWYFFFGVTASKIFGYNRYQKKKGKYDDEEIIDL